MTETREPIPPIRDILNFVAIDIETTGLDPRKDEIIEIAAVRFVKGVVTETFDSFVKPKRSVPRFIEVLTHITASDLKDAPPVSSVLEKLKVFIGDSPLVGHNINFDLGFINENLVRCGFMHLANRSWDTAEISRVYLPFTSDHKLGTLAQTFDIDLVNAHRADADATATGHVLVKLTELIDQHYSLLLNARILDLSKQAQLEDMKDYMGQVVEYQRHYALLGAKAKAPENKLVNMIEHQVASPGTQNLDDVFAEGGTFAHKFPNYEYRSGQLMMAKHIKNAFEHEHHLAVEAGTGVGKSFAYLVPAIEFAHLKKTKVLISTNTKNLQEQLFFKDIPQLCKLLPVPFKATLVKGRENYVCERRWEDMLAEQARGITAYEAHALLYLLIWKQLTQTGDVSENSSFDRNRFSFVWRKVCSDRYLCAGRKCPHNKSCFVMNLRKNIEDSSIVVANHSLLLADLRAENSTLGEYSYLVVDEAHNLMASASKHLGFDFSYAEVINLFNQLASSQKRSHRGFLSQLTTTIGKSLVTDAQKSQIVSLVKNLEINLEETRLPITDLFNEAFNLCQQADSFGKMRIKDHREFPRLVDKLSRMASGWKLILKDLSAISNVLSTCQSKQVQAYDVLTENLSSFVMRLMEAENQIITLLNPDLENYALWIENNPKPERNIPASTLCYAPIEVGAHLANMLYNRVPSIVFTSATLALRGSFRYFFGQSGLNLVDDKEVKEEIVDSPFEYDKQARLMISSFLPEPKDKFFQNQALGCLEQIVSSSEVGTMVLFTSYKDLNSVFDHLSDTLYQKQRSFYAQGKGGSRSSILNEFIRAKNAVLLGTSSFWEGVDIRGESLSLLILYKLPFMVPSEPVVEAYIDKLEREDKDSFMHFMLPNALLRLRQGFGRLIRSKSDRGIVLVMDSRVSNKKYGDFFKQVLPCRSLELRDENQLLTEITRFFNQN